MKNILKVIGLSLSAALSCSADKCWNCNVNDATGATSGLCEQCKAQQCTHCGKVDPSVMHFPVNGSLCEECRSHRCDHCCNFDPSVEHFVPDGFMCEQCRKTQQDPFGM